MSNEQNNYPVIDKSYAIDYPNFVPDNTIVLDRQFMLVDLQQFQPNARRIAGTMATVDADSYFQYVMSRQKEVGQRFKSRTFVDAVQPERSLRAISVLNFGTESQNDDAGHQDDLATLDLQHDVLFNDFMSKFKNEQYKTIAFAEALEDFNGVLKITARTDGEEQTLGAAISAFRNLKVQTNQTSVVNSSAFKSEQSDMEVFEAEALGGSLPTHLTVTTPLYMGLVNQEVTFKVKMVQEKDGDKAVAYFSLLPVALKHHYIKAGVNFQELVRSKLTEEEVTIGKWSKGTTSL